MFLCLLKLEDHELNEIIYIPSRCIRSCSVFFYLFVCFSVVVSALRIDFQGFCTKTPLCVPFPSLNTAPLNTAQFNVVDLANKASVLSPGPEPPIDCAQSRRKGKDTNSACFLLERKGDLRGQFCQSNDLGDSHCNHRVNFFFLPYYVLQSKYPNLEQEVGRRHYRIAWKQHEQVQK